MHSFVNFIWFKFHITYSFVNSTWFRLHLTNSFINFTWFKLHITNSFINFTWFKLHITLSLVNSTWFAFPCHQNIDYIPLFRPGAICLICWHFELSRNKHSFKIKIIFPNNSIPNDTEFTFMEKFCKNINLLILKKNPLFIEWPLCMCVCLCVCVACVCVSVCVWERERERVRERESMCVYILLPVV